MHRRTVLRTGALTAIAGIAGCAGGDGDDGSTETDASPSDGDGRTPDPDQVVEVAPGGSLSFAPDEFEIETGGAVLWRFEAGGHNVKPESMPENAGWTGTEGGESDTVEEGHEHSHTFDVPGAYEYYCGPHRSAGMTGSFTVG